MGGLTLDFRLTLPVVTHDQGHLGKINCFVGMYCCLGGVMGPPWSQSADTGWVGGWFDFGF